MKHQELIEKIEDLLLNYFDADIDLKKVPAHSDEMGNKGADMLARQHIRSLI